jgi:hypothetical protein
MSMLGRRLSALEEIAETVRRRELRDLVMSLPEARGLTPNEMDEVVSLHPRRSKRHSTTQPRRRCATTSSSAPKARQVPAGPPCVVATARSCAMRRLR